MFCAVHTMSFAQIKVSNTGTTGMGANPLSDSRLYLYSNTASSPNVNFGLRSLIEDFTNTSNPISSQPMYGAYFKSTRSNPGHQGPPPSNQLYGIYVDNTYSNWGTSWGMYLKNTGSSGAGGSLYGIQVTNVDLNMNGQLYGIHLSNTKTTGGNNIYGVYSTNLHANSAVGGDVYGAYLYAKSVNPSSMVYGIYSEVSGGNNNTYSGYFKGGKVYVQGTLDVNGFAYVNGQNVLTSDERLKSNIKPLFDEKEKLYLLQGKSYIKMLPTSPIEEEDSLMGKREIEIVEFPEYGYLAQELKEVFPDLVKQNSNGYYGVNYIGLIPIIVEALKDQRKDQQLESEKKQTEINDLKVQINEQREQIKQLVKLLDLKAINEKLFEDNGIESLPILLQNTPNPFNQATEIGYFIPENVNSANIYIYDINGFQERNIPIYERGKGATTLQASALQAGIYFYTLICDGKPVDTKQMILTR